MCVCVCVTNTNTTKKDYLTKVPDACYLSIFYRILIVFIRRNVPSSMLFISFFRWVDEISVVFCFVLFVFF